MRSISPADAEMIKAYLHLIEASLDSSGNVDGLLFHGQPVSGIATYTRAQAQAGGFDLTTARHFMISDVYSDTDGQPSLWYIHPTASTQKRKLVSSYVVFSTIALLEASFPAASYPGLRALITSFNGSGGIEVKSNGTRYVPRNGRACLFRDSFGTVASPTLTVGAGSTSFTFSISTPTIPAGMLAVDDMLFLKFSTNRHNANATIPFSVCLGTAGTTSDAVIWSASIPATDALKTNGDCCVAITASTSFTSNSQGAQSGTGGTTGVVDGTTNVNTASAMIFTFGGTKNTNDTIDLLRYSIEWAAS